MATEDAPIISDSKNQTSVPSLSPSWKDLTEFIDKQAEKNRAVIDYWFKLAIAVLSLLFIVFAGALTFFGVKTASDTKEAAVKAAAEQAEKVMDQNPARVLDTMAKDEKFKTKLLEKLSALAIAQKTTDSGSDSQGVRPAAASQKPPRNPPPKHGTAPPTSSGPISPPQSNGRVITETVKAKYLERLKTYKDKQVEVVYCPEPEASTFTDALVHLLQEAGLRTPHFVPSDGACSAEYGRIIARDPGLLDILRGLLTEIDGGHPPLLQPDKVPQNSDDAAAVVIGSK
jgi:hypothetical protein